MTLIADVWADRILALGGLVTAITGFIALWRRINTTNGNVETNTRNIQTGAVVGLANSLAIQAMPGPSVPHEVVQAARAIADDPTTPVPTPCNTDPVPGDDHESPLRVQT